MQKLYIPWSLKGRFTTGKIYFLGAKPYLLKTNVWQGCPSGFSKCEFLHGQTWTHGHISTAAELEDAGCCWCPQICVAVSGPLSWFLCSCSFTTQRAPLSSGPGSWSHCWECQVLGTIAPGGALGQRGLVQKCESPASSPEKVQTQGCGFDRAEAGALLEITPSLSSPLPQPVSSTPPPVSLGNPSFTYCGPESWIIQSCPALCDPLDYSPPGSSVDGILQARIREWVACPPLADLPDPAPEPVSCVSCTAGEFCATLPPGRPLSHINCMQILNSGSTS